MKDCVGLVLGHGCLHGSAVAVSQHAVALILSRELGRLVVLCDGLVVLCRCVMSVENQFYSLDENCSKQLCRQILSTTCANLTCRLQRSD